MKTYIVTWIVDIIVEAETEDEAKSVFLEQLRLGDLTPVAADLDILEREGDPKC